ncbi:hypothetical protein Tco_0566812 [Tanacetum coccineum]
MHPYHGGVGGLGGVVFGGGAWCDDVGDGSVVAVMAVCVDGDEDDGDDGLKMVGCGGDNDDDGAVGGGRPPAAAGRRRRRILERRGRNMGARVCIQ